MAGAGMYVHESGAPGSPAVLFLHGAGTSGRMWRDHLAVLGERFHCLAPDLPGFGRSNQLPPLSRPVTADLVAELVAARVPAGRAHVVGLSWGGALAHSLLDRHPALADRVVVDGAGVLTARSGVAVLLGVAAVSPFLGTRPVSAFFRTVVGMDEEGRAELQASSPRAFRNAFVEGFRSGVSRVEVRSASPTLLVAGGKETAVRPSNAALAALVPHAEARYVPDLPHGWAARRPELHVAMVEAWLTGQDLPAELLPEVPDRAVVRRLLRELGEDPRQADAVLAARSPR
jgi:pimeloyl-ACP methyl ester carboxylesterase